MGFSCRILWNGFRWIWWRTRPASSVRTRRSFITTYSCLPSKRILGKKGRVYRKCTFFIASRRQRRRSPRMSDCSRKCPAKQALHCEWQDISQHSAAYTALSIDVRNGLNFWIYGHRDLQVLCQLRCNQNNYNLSFNNRTITNGIKGHSFWNEWTSLVVGKMDEKWRSSDWLKNRFLHVFNFKKVENSLICASFPMNP